MQSPERVFLNYLFKGSLSWYKQDNEWKAELPEEEPEKVVKKANAALKTLPSKIPLVNNPPFFQKLFGHKRRPRRKPGEVIPAEKPATRTKFRYLIAIHSDDLFNLYLENEKNAFKKKLEKEIQSQILESEGEVKINMDEIKKVVDEAAQAHIDAIKGNHKKFEEEKNPFKPR